MRQLGEIVGVTPAAISHWERGHFEPRAKLLPSLSVALGVSVDELVAENEIAGKTVSAAEVITRARQDIANALSVDVSAVRIFVGEGET